MNEAVVTRSAPATVANQPGFDVGGFAVKVLETLGETPDWETLEDTIELHLSRGAGGVTVENVIYEEGAHLPTDPALHTAGRLVLGALALLPERGVTDTFAVHMVSTKGISCRGTGLGSSGAPPAAALEALLDALQELGIADPFTDADKSLLLMQSDFGVPDNCIPAYYGGMQRIVTQEGRVTPERLTVHSDFGFFVLVTPTGFGIPTQAAREALVGAVPPPEYAGYLDDMVASLQTGDASTYGELMERAHHWFVSRRRVLYPGDGALFDAVCRAAKHAGALGYTISGAGPTLLAITKDREVARSVAFSMQTALQESGYASAARICTIS